VTAIFLVWNRKGLAVAADSALSLVRELEDGTAQTISTTETSKIIRVPNRNLVAACSGNDLINDLPISGVIDRWASICPASNSLYDHAENFIRWFCEVALLEHEAIDDYVRGSLVSQFQTIKKGIESEQVGERSQSEVVDWYYDYWETCSYPSVYGSAKNKHEPREKVKGDEHLYSEFVERFTGQELDEQVYLEYLEQVESSFDGAYQIVFKDSPWYQGEDISHLKLRSVKFNMDYIFEDEGTTLMLAGYGEEDWIPRCVVMKLFDSNLLMPRIVVTRVTDPNAVWYQDIGESSAVNKFFDPIDYQVLRELRETLREKFRGRNYLDKVMVEIDDSILKHSDDLYAPVRRRVKVFNTERLAFVASQMVALESLNSLIKEDLPSVGGRIDVVQLTRSGFVESQT